ncbi:CpXC domain-containing protein [[Clostridium] innocuum]|nr:hypothetical protein [[Clostridium] innocuum]MCC2787280.1 CpXC domain-containing protein [[Clostridium] innocuum]MCC2796408.1 CpXC domain-containing protein [[Clostridium] innocuum]MCC2830361.1 CpXC domain-containing protein [[Clostridium] innocuum]MCG4497019.1 CpXC domain-containing protein [[Clostridium] innocuum]MCR0403037.1 CpXC domain-containing protein [[Clostridium] innocuum]
MMDVICDVCNKEIDAESIVIQEERFADGLINAFFVCPSCGKKFHLLYHDDKTKELQEKIQACDDIHQKAKKKALVRKLKARLDQINNRV